MDITLKKITHLYHGDLNWDSHLVGNVEKPFIATPLGWTHPRQGELWFYNEGIRSWQRNSEPGVSSVARRWPISSKQLECDWLAGAIPLSTVHSNSLLYFLLFWETNDLVWEIISVSEKRMKNCIVKIIDNVFEKMTKVVYFL